MVKVNCLLEVAVALRQLNPIHKKGPSSFKVFKVFSKEPDSFFWPPYCLLCHPFILFLIVPKEYYIFEKQPSSIFCWLSVEISTSELFHPCNCDMYESQEFAYNYVASSVVSKKIYMNLFNLMLYLKSIYKGVFRTRLNN